jgi:hypothetical protein
MATERAFCCGNSKYYVAECYGLLVVHRQDWLGRTFIGHARNYAEAMVLMQSDARSGRVRAA